MKVTNLINGPRGGKSNTEGRLIVNDYEAEYREAEGEAGEIVLRSHFNSGDFIIVAEGGWKLVSVVCGTCQYASTVPDKYAVQLENGDQVLDKLEGLSFCDWREIAYEIKALNKGLKDASYHWLKPIIKLARRYGDTPLARKAGAILATAR